MRKRAKSTGPTLVCTTKDGWKVWGGVGDLLTCNGPEIAYTVFSNTITELFDTCFPLRTVKHGYKTRKPWLTEIN